MTTEHLRADASRPQDSTNGPALLTQQYATSTQSVLGFSNFDHLKTAGIDELRSLSNPGAIVLSEEGVNAILQNPIVVEAYMQGFILSMSVKEGQRSTFTWATLSYGTQIDTSNDYDERMINGQTTFYPKSILAYKKTKPTAFESVTRDGAFAAYSLLTEDFVDRFLAEAKEYGAIELPTIYSGNDAEQLLVQKGIRTILKVK